MRLEGRKALVTGGAGGIGAAIARRLAAEGSDVTIGDLDVDGAREVASEISGEAVELDVTDLASAQAAVEAAGTLDILVNNAGTDEFGFFNVTTPEQWKKVIDVNLYGVLNCTYAALPGMQAAGYGRLVNIASEAGRVGSKGSAVYSAAKGGVIAFTKVMAREGARFGINANAIAPGPIEEMAIAIRKKRSGTRRAVPRASRMARRARASIVPLDSDTAKSSVTPARVRKSWVGKPPAIWFGDQPATNTPMIHASAIESRPTLICVVQLKTMAASRASRDARAGVTRPRGRL